MSLHPSTVKPNIRLIRKREVSRDAQLRAKVSDMIAESRQGEDHHSLPSIWEYTLAENFYAIFDQNEDKPVGLIGWKGPHHRVDTSWWIHPKNRRKGYGTRAVELLAEVMARKGIKDFKAIISAVPGEDTASGKLAIHLRMCLK